MSETLLPQSPEILPKSSQFQELLAASGMDSNYGPADKKRLESLETSFYNTVGITQTTERKDKIELLKNLIAQDLGLNPAGKSGFGAEDEKSKSKAAKA